MLDVSELVARVHSPGWDLGRTEIPGWEGMTGGIPGERKGREYRKKCIVLLTLFEKILMRREWSRILDRELLGKTQRLGEGWRAC